MSSFNRLSGNILFEDVSSLASSATIRIVLLDGQKNKITEKLLDYDIDSLSVFKYLPFELRNFELDSTKKYTLFVHVDNDANDKIDASDLVSDNFSVETGQEYFDINVKRPVLS